ncbi:alanine racemase [Cupriavidus basilensis]|uniref:alanine racemase n=1 Tax=Cupriavidus sp. SK-3 TaxID=1470558 RepID=UPI00044A057B|nr:alanine racemase [Cupriavidus sp. SK-3]KDP85935.1 alanine racemase [Cupriavidus sp. SK-3]
MSNPEQTSASAMLTIDLGAIRDNWRTLKAKVGAVECAAVVKADAYGLGAAKVAPALYRAGCRYFFVAHLNEAIALRPALPGDAALYVLHGIHPDSERDFVNHGVVPVLNSLAQVQTWGKLARERGGHLPAVLQVDTGMARLGLSCEELESLAADHGMLSGIDLRLIMSHLVSAENQAEAINDLQLARFRVALARLPKARASLANSSGIFLGRDYHFDLVRPGAALYGVAPIAGMPNPLRPVIKLEGKVIQTRWIAAGNAVGYSHAWTAPRRSRIATVAVGYADGFFRSLSNKAVASFMGYCLPLVGNVSMDTVTLDVTDVPAHEIAEGTLITLADNALHVDKIASRAGTIGYEVLTSLGNRYMRSYIDD